MGQLRLARSTEPKHMATIKRAPVPFVRYGLLTDNSGRQAARAVEPARGRFMPIDHAKCYNKDSRGIWHQAELHQFEHMVRHIGRKNKGTVLFLEITNDSFLEVPSLFFFFFGGIFPSFFHLFVLLSKICFYNVLLLGDWFRVKTVLFVDFIKICMFLIIVILSLFVLISKIFCILKI